MLNPEDFRRQLDEALADKQKADQREKVVCEAKQRQDTEEVQERVRQQQLETEVAERQKNQTVVELDSQLPIRQYLWVLKDLIAPNQPLMKWGPSQGIIAYTLVYKEEEKETPVDTYRTIDRQAQARNPRQDPHVILEAWEPRTVRNILGVALNNFSEVKLCIRACAKNSKFNPESENPFDWLEEKDGRISRFGFDYGYGVGRDRTGLPLTKKMLGWAIKDKDFLLSSIEGSKQFMQALTEFYVGLKTG